MSNPIDERLKAIISAILPPPNLSSILRFLLMNTEKAHQGETRKVRKLRFNESVDAV
jgi:hypothetical protein